MTEKIPGLTPQVADAARDVLAIIRAEMDGDREAEFAIVGTLNREEAITLLVMTASLTARIIRSSSGDAAKDYMANFAREYLT